MSKDKLLYNSTDYARIEKELRALASDLSNIRSKLNAVDIDPDWSVYVSADVKLRTVSGYINSGYVRSVVRSAATIASRLSAQSSNLAYAVRSASDKFEDADSRILRAFNQGDEGGAWKPTATGNDSDMPFADLFAPENLWRLSGMYPGLFQVNNVLGLLANYLPLVGPGLSFAKWYVTQFYDQQSVSASNEKDWTWNKELPFFNTKLDAYADWLGYDAKAEAGLNSAEAKISAYLGKVHAGYETDFTHGNLDLTLGKFDAKAEAGLFEVDMKENGSYEITVAKAEAGVSVKALDGEYVQGIGGDQLGYEMKATGDLLKGELKGGINIGYGSNDEGSGLNAYAEGSAMLSAASGKVKGTIKVLGIEVAVYAKGYAGAVGVEGEIGVKNNKFVAEAGGAAGVGGGLGIEIGINETYVENAKAVASWGINTVKTGAEYVGKGAEVIGSGIEAVGSTVGKGIEAVGNGINSGIQAVGSTVQAGAQAVGSTVQSGIEYIGSGIKSAGRALSNLWS